MALRRQFLLALAGSSIIFGGCSGSFGTTGERRVTPPIASVEFETDDVEVDSTNEPTVEASRSEGTVSIAGWAKVGSQNCRRLSLGDVEYDRAAERLHIVVESVPRERSFVDRSLKGCELSLLVSAYSVTVLLDGTFPSEVTVRERYNGSESVRTFSV